MVECTCLASFSVRSIEKSSHTTHTPNISPHRSIKKELKDDGPQIQGGITPRSTVDSGATAHMAVQSPGEVVEGGVQGQGHDVKKDGNLPQGLRIDSKPDAAANDGDGGAPIDMRDSSDTMYEKICTLQEYNRMKADILRYHCVKLEESHCGDADISSKLFSINKSTLVMKLVKKNMSFHINFDIPL